MFNNEGMFERRPNCAYQQSPQQYFCYTDTNSQSPPTFTPAIQNPNYVYYYPCQQPLPHFANHEHEQLQLHHQPSLPTTATTATTMMLSTTPRQFLHQQVLLEAADEAFNLSSSSSPSPLSLPTSSPSSSSSSSVCQVIDGGIMLPKYPGQSWILYHCLLQLLLLPHQYSNVIRWTGFDWEFQIIDTQALSQIWSKWKNAKGKMEPTKFSHITRALRNYYPGRKNILVKEPRMKNCYRFQNHVIRQILGDRLAKSPNQLFSTLGIDF